MIPAKKAMEIGRDNRFGRWSGSEDSARDRIAERLIVPVGHQTFEASPTDTFFAIGSCFARNVEERLELAGATVTSRHIAVRDLGNNSAREGGIFNKYTPTSILQELRWASGEEDFPAEAFLKNGPNTVYDPFLSGKAGSGTVEELMARRAEIRAYFAQAFSSDVVIITLGLIECWIDNQTGYMLNEAPSPRIIARNPDRFSFHCMSADESRDALKASLDLLAKHGKAGQRRIVTVSPVPLGRTFTADDIVIANMTSKSRLRVAVKDLLDAEGTFDYFPSYEGVLHSDPNLSWQGDRRHVSDVVVGQIIKTFLERYGIATDQEDVDVAALQDDASFAAWSERAATPDELLARMNAEVNKYKNMVIRLQADLRKLEQSS